MTQSFTKADSLKKIKKKNWIFVPFFLFFEKKTYLKKKKIFIKKIKKTFKNDIILRSSALNEDNLKESKAGFYDSYLIKRKNFNTLEIKIEKLISKFKNNKDQIIVQKYLKNPEIAGVIFTKDKTTNAPYYDINYDTSKKSDLITSGKYNPTIKSLIILKSAKIIPFKFKIDSNFKKPRKNI